MTDVLKDLQPRKVFAYFEAISNIPRGSGNEQAISDYLVQFAKDLGLEVKQDEVNNVYIKKPASIGYEKAPTVILQGHMDMVCEKEKDVTHDFLKDGLSLVVEGDWLRAKGTTLGGDDGIAVAYAMAVLADDNLKHPALEVFITTDEERGMTGVAGMHPEYLTGKVLLNLDTEKEGEFLVSCAGGAKAYLTLPIEREAFTGMKAYSVMIKGLKGGHSGADIHFERGNAHLLMGRFLNVLSEKTEFRLIDLIGGSKDNVITRECEAIIAVKDSEVLKALAEEYEVLYKDEYRIQDSGVTVTVQEAEPAQMAIKKEVTEQLVKLLLTLPNGVQGYDQAMPELVQTSLNLGIVQIEEDVMRLGTAVRSSSASKKEELLAKLKALSELSGAGFEVKGDYPAWEYKAESRIREIAVALYEETYGQKPEVTAIHAGLECGFISEKLPGLDMIAIGPDIEDIHSPQERLSISSTKRVYEYMVKLLEKLVEY